MNVKTIKRPTFIEALIPITFLIIISVGILKFEANPKFPLLLTINSSIQAVLYAIISVAGQLLELLAKSLECLFL